MHTRILLAATGLTPQIVTETLYGLASLPEPDRFVPDELHVLTTQRGKELVDALFVQDHANQVDELCRQYGLREPKVQIHVLRAKTGPLDDVRTAADNDAAADFILQVVRQVTARQDTAVHFSIAGGRKTMGYYLGTCASLLGRPQDRMSHVLVNEPFESAPEFFFPPREPTFMLLRGRPTDTSRAKVQLANVGFIRLRPLLPAQLVDRGSFTRLVRVLDSIVGEPRLVLRFRPHGADREGARGEVEIGGGLSFTLQPKSFAMYWLLAKQASRGGQSVSQEMATEVMRRDFLDVYRRLSGLGRYDEEDRQFLSTPGSFLRTAYQNAMSRLTANLKKELGEAATRVYGPHKEGSGKTLQHRLMLPAEAIRFES
jgi:CRISPR-associated protein (TIGR02584 family)